MINNFERSFLIYIVFDIVLIRRIIILGKNMSFYLLSKKVI